jgi:hypothetical protein
LAEPPSQVKPPLIISHLQWLDMHEWRALEEQQPQAAEALYQDSLKKSLQFSKQIVWAERVLDFSRTRSRKLY